MQRLLKGSVHFFDVEHMLNLLISDVPPWKDFFGGHPFGLQVLKRGVEKPSERGFPQEIDFFSALIVVLFELEIFP